MTTSAQRGLKGPPSPRQNEVLLLVGQGLTNIEIGERLGIGPRTVKQHVSKLTVKFGVKKKRELVPIAQALGRGELVFTVPAKKDRTVVKTERPLSAEQVFRIKDEPVDRSGPRAEHGAVIWDDAAKQALDGGDAQ